MMILLYSLCISLIAFVSLRLQSSPSPVVSRFQLVCYFKVACWKSNVIKCTQIYRCETLFRQCSSTCLTNSAPGCYPHLLSMITGTGIQLLVEESTQGSPLTIMDAMHILQLYCWTKRYGPLALTSHKTLEWLFSHRLRLEVIDKLEPLQFASILSFTCFTKP